MEIKNANTPKTTITRTLNELDATTENIYESVNIIAKRANQLNVEIKEELSNKLAEFAFVTDNLEETFENREQIEVSRYYERLPKPTLIATEEFLEGELGYRKRTTSTDS